jgi:hypothetical protein
MGRNDGMSWPQCSFEVVSETGRIPFGPRPTRPTWTITDLPSQSSSETEIKPPNYRDLAIFKEGNPFSGHCTPGHYVFSLKTLPPPQAGELANPAQVLARQPLLSIRYGLESSTACHLRQRGQLTFRKLPWIYASPNSMLQSQALGMRLNSLLHSRKLRPPFSFPANPTLCILASSNAQLIPAPMWLTQPNRLV